MPLWAATTFWFLRSYRTRSALYAALAGVGAAACMLGKYWSVFLLAGLAVAALVDARRADYFRSAAPWITIAVGLLVLSPHLVWLARHDFAPFSYALGIHGEKPFTETAVAALGYLLGSLGYVAVPLIVAAVMLVRSPPRKRGPGAAQHDSAGMTLDSRRRGNERGIIADIIWPSERERRLAAAAFWAPLLLPALVALASGTEITSLWSMPAFTLLPVLLLSSPAVTVRDIDARRMVIAAVAAPLILLIASPLIAMLAQRDEPQPAGAQARLLAGEVAGAWHLMTPRPLRFVGGDADLAYGVVSYAPARPRALIDMAPPAAAELARGGQAIVCFAEDAGCRGDAAAQAARVAGSRSIETTIVRNFLRQPGKPQRYVIVLVPPR
jgi:hypothetical protein